MKAYPHANQFPNIDNSFGCENARRVFFSSQVYKTRFPLMNSVFGKANPLKIIGIVIGLISVYMVYSQSKFVSINKSQTNKSMNQMLYPFPISKHGNL